MRRNSGEVEKVPFTASQSYHFRITKTQDFTGRNFKAPPMMHREAPNDPKLVHTGKIQQQKVLGPLWDL